MSCPSCNSPLEQNARFCGVCGYRLQPMRTGGNTRPNRQAGAASPPVVAPTIAASAAGAIPAGPAGPVPPKPPIGAARAARADASPLPAPGAGAGAPPKPGAARAKAKPKAEDIYLGQVLNNRFKVESKIGEGGFGAVYRGVQLATGRKVALKLLHPEMTKDDNLVARFRREGMVLCNLRDAHTITTYDFDQTPDGTLYIAMELLEGKSLHQLFHDQAPLEWKRMFKILTEMCSSLAEAHAQGIVHRDLKPENVYLESRPGNPEFVKILDFGIAKVMRGDSIDPQSPQLTATGQTLGTLEYMSPEQLMGKPLDGRSDVYALGVVAYEMITGRLPFPDAKGPAGLITAQLKQTPIPPSQANPERQIPPAADRVILKCLEKDKNNRYADVSQLAAALQDAVADPGLPAAHAPERGSAPGVRGGLGQAPERRGDRAGAATPPTAVPQLAPQPVAAAAAPPPYAGPLPGVAPGHALPGSSPGHALPGSSPGHALPGSSPEHALPGHAPHGTTIPGPGLMGPGPGPGGMAPGLSPGMSGIATPPPALLPQAPQAPHAYRPPTPAPGVPLGPLGPGQSGLAHYPQPGSPGALMPHPGESYPQLTPYPSAYPAPRRSISWVWWVAGLLVLGAGVGALTAILTR